MNLSEATVALLEDAGFTPDEIARIFAPPPGGHWALSSPNEDSGSPKGRPAPRERKRPKVIPAADRDNTDAEFRRLYVAGYSYAGIGAALGIPQGSMYWHVKRLALPPRPRRTA